MRHIKGPVKQSGDVHPPELDDDGLDEVDSSMAFDAPTAQGNAVMSETAAPARRMQASQPSWMPLLGLLAGGLLLFRLMR